MFNFDITKYKGETEPVVVPTTPKVMEILQKCEEVIKYGDLPREDFNHYRHENTENVLNSREGMVIQNEDNNHEILVGVLRQVASTGNPVKLLFNFTEDSGKFNKRKRMQLWVAKEMSTYNRCYNARLRMVEVWENNRFVGIQLVCDKKHAMDPIRAKRVEPDTRAMLQKKELYGVMEARSRENGNVLIRVMCKVMKNNVAITRQKLQESQEIQQYVGNAWITFTLERM